MLLDGGRAGSAGGVGMRSLSLLAIKPEQVTPNKEEMTDLQVKTRGKQVFFCLLRFEWDAHFEATLKS